METFGLDPKGKFGDGRIPMKSIIQALNILEKYLSDEGLIVVLNFVKGTKGINRSWILGRLISLYTGKVKHITKTDLRSYTNSDLFKLFETGDLKEIKKGYVIPGNYTEVSDEEKIKDFLREKVQDFIEEVIPVTFK